MFRIMFARHFMRAIPRTQRRYLTSGENLTNGGNSSGGKDFSKSDIGGKDSAKSNIDGKDFAKSNIDGKDHVGKEDLTILQRVSLLGKKMESALGDVPEVPKWIAGLLIILFAIEEFRFRAREGQFRKLIGDQKVELENKIDGQKYSALADRLLRLEIRDDYLRDHLAVNGAKAGAKV